MKSKLLLSAMLTALSACAVIKSDKISELPSGQLAALEGQEYYLPIFLYRIDLAPKKEEKPEQKPPEGASDDQQPQKPTAAPKKADAAPAKSTQKPKKNEAAANAGDAAQGAQAPGNGKQGAKPAEDGSTTPAAAENPSQDEDTEPKAQTLSSKQLVDMTITTKNCGDYQLTVQGPTVVGDESAAYLLKYTPSPLSDDDIKLKTSFDGLLQSVNTKVKDQTPDILVKAAQLGIAIATGIPPTPEEKKAANEQEQTPCDVKPALSFYANPVKEAAKPRADENSENDAQPEASDQNKPATDDDSDVKDILGYLGINIRFDRLSRPAAVQTSAPSANGVFYRPIIPVRLRLTTGTSAVDTILLSADNATTRWIEVRRAAFVESSTNIVFSSGVTIEIAYSKPSEANAFISIPLTIAGKVIAVPIDALKSAFTKTESQSDLVKAQADLLKNKTDYQKALTDYQKALDSGDVGPTEP